MRKQKVHMYSMRDFLFTIKQLASVRISEAAGARTYHYIWLMTNIFHIKRGINFLGKVSHQVE